MRFDFAIAHLPGKLLYTADSLSRSPRESKAQGLVPQSPIKLTLDWWKILIATSLALKNGFNKIVAQKDCKL